MNAEILAIGSELLTPQRIDTNSLYLTQKLNDLGVEVTGKAIIGDDRARLTQAIEHARTRVPLLILSGGLGPTEDDVTRDAIARLLGRNLREDEAILAHIRNFFAQRNRPVPPSTRVEAAVPEGALVLPNGNGTAPGLAIEVRPNPFRPGGAVSWLVMLPGPPRELRPMFAESVVPFLRRVFPVTEPFVCRTLRTLRIGESVAQEKISGPLKRLTDEGLEVGYCARPGQVDVRLTARGTRADQLVREAEAIVAAQLGSDVFGRDDEELETIIVRLLAERGQTLSTAESCTGGGVAHQLTNVPGASEVFLGGFVTYSDASKQELLRVPGELLARQGAVSEPVARAMAEGARRAVGSDYAIAVTGIAGPAGGTPDKPVGTVFIALASPEGTEVWLEHNPWDRPTFKDVTTRQALNQLRLHLKKFA